MNDFANLGSEVARQLGEPPAARSAEQRKRFVGAALSQRPAPAWKRSAVWALAAAAVVAIGIGATLSWHSSEATVATGTSAPDAADTRPEVWLRGGEQSGPVVLDEDVTIDLSTAARARLQRLSPGQRQLTIENGQLKIELDPGSPRQWSFLAGAYRVDVLGTVFSMNYEPHSGALEVAVTRGRVRVSGGTLATQGITLGAGQHLQVAGDTVQVERPPAQEDPPPAASGSAAAPTPSAPVEPNTDSPSWSALYRSGDYAAALAAAEQQGFDALLQSAGPGELSNLADAARLSGSSGRARQALLALRQRFAGTPVAAQAAFLLGRMQGSPRWFETYLQEQPSGAYAPEAAGRLMVAYRDTGDLGRARTAAQTYLSRYPQGAYAELARSLVAKRGSRR